MKNIVTFLFLVFISQSLFSQTITFEQGEVIFEHPRSEDTGLNYPFLPFDYNQDGITDFTGSSFGDQYVYKGLADGTYEPIELTWSQRPIKIIDWDKDGDEDSVFERHVRITNPDDEFFLLNPSVNFGEKITDVADINNDSHYDLVTINRITFADNEVAIYMNNGDDTFEKTIIADDEEYEIAIFGDITMDGYPELVYSGSSTYIGINDGTGAFTTQEEKFSGSDRDIILDDLDNDGDPELVLMFGVVRIYENVDGTIDKSTEKSISESGAVIKAGDLNGDGWKDLVALNYEGFDFKIKLMTNDGSGNFSSSETITSFDKPSFIGIPDPEIQRNNIVLYDHDRDGRLDIVYVEGITVPNAIMYLKNSTMISSIPEVSSNQVNIYPNPTSDFIRIDLDINQYKNFEIIDFKGSIVKSGALESTQIEVLDLTSGNYVLLVHPVNDSEKTLSINFIKR